MKIISLLILLFSCTSNSPESDNLNRVAFISAKRIEKNTLLIPSGVGGSIPEKIKYCTLSFDYPGSLSIEAGRNLLITCLKTTLDTFQNDQNIQEYLFNKPFQIENINIFIYSNLSNEKECNPEIISSLSLVRGILEYDRFDTQTNQYITIYKETYEEALQKCAF